VAVPPTNLNLRPYRPPDYAEEWKLLRKAWSLARNGQIQLSENLIAKASEELYPPEHRMDTLQDWVWRFATFLCNPHYEGLFADANKAIESLSDSVLWWDFRQFYKTVAQERGTRYFTIMNNFFDAHAEFAQVYFFVAKGLTVPTDQHTTSTDFEAVKMFYGNIYEQFTVLVDYLAMLNNMLAGRRYDDFPTMTLRRYRELDRAQRFAPFLDNAAFMAMCVERDNQLRNASHHGSLEFNPVEQIIRFRSGKGGTGSERRISYADYLSRCVQIFLQAMTLLRVELVTATFLEVPHPI
jgi:hypothetical protein